MVAHSLSPGYVGEKTSGVTHSGNGRSARTLGRDGQATEKNENEPGGPTATRFALPLLPPDAGTDRTRRSLGRVFGSARGYCLAAVGGSGSVRTWPGLSAFMCSPIVCRFASKIRVLRSPRP